jgi:DNA-binding NtrC family response regulator
VPDALVLDDDDDVRRALTRLVEREGFRVQPCENLARARAELASRRWDVIVADLQLPDGQSLELLPEIESQPATDLILITGHGTVDTAVEAFRGGAVDYLTKPVDAQHLRQLLRKVLRTAELRGEVDLLRSELRRAGRFGKMIGASSKMQALYDQVLRVAPTQATVLIQGETGTGKELVAETIHGMSPRARGPFVAVNCGAVAEKLVESELFGHERGAFTGAAQRHHGVFERADGGTLFLDEITEMPLDLQVRLLRALESGRVQRVGSEMEIAVDVRVVAASNRSVEQAVRDGALREDLFFRLAVFPVEVPPLRDRDGDVERIAEHFLALHNERAGTKKRFEPDAMARLEAQAWPGNVRELRNTVERAFILAEDAIGPEHLSFGSGSADEGDDAWPEVGTSLAEAERELILATVERLGDKKEAARTLGVSLKTLYNRLHKYGAM